MRVRSRAVLALGVLAVLVIGSLYIWREFLANSLTVGAVREPPLHDTPRMTSDRPRWQPPQSRPKAKVVTESEREELLSRAQVWRQPPVPIELLDCAREGEDPRQVDCRFRVTELGGTTPKFDCNVESGELIRVKYGKTGEVPGEVASTRLLRALGFGADYVTFVQRLRCYGCPEEPFTVMKAVAITQAEALYKSLMLSYDKYEDFAWVAVERRFEGRAVETLRNVGWAMFELDKVSPDKGGAPRAHVDALRLFAVFIAHWDNKADNQRLVCLSQDDWDNGERCAQPFLILQDVGATFGPIKVDLDGWNQAPIWEDRRTCLTSMRQLPFNGATYGQHVISEDGRRFLADMLVKLTDRQLTDLFTTSRFDEELGLFRRSSTVADWVLAFKARVRQIAEGPPCPPLSALAGDEARRRRRLHRCARSPGRTTGRVRSPRA